MSDTRDTAESDGFGVRVRALVAAIPEGRVATYGQIAALAGNPRAARVVGGILRNAGEELPWHRVVNRHGGISTYRIGAGDLQVALLQSEDVGFEGDCVELSEHLWRPAIRSDGIVELDPEGLR